jgi:hypothetical protein
MILRLEFSSKCASSYTVVISYISSGANIFRVVKYLREQQTLVNLGSRAFHVAPCFLSHFVLHQLRQYYFLLFFSPSKPGHVFSLRATYFFSF